jgi:hypothetical protein
MSRKATLMVSLVGLLVCVALAGYRRWTTEVVKVRTQGNSSVTQTADDSLDTLRNQMVKVGTWVFDHNGLFGEVDRGTVTWTFADDGTMKIEDTDETNEFTYSLTKYCGGYGKIGGGNNAYLKVKSDGGHVDCYIVNDLVQPGPPEEKSLLLSNDRGSSLYLIPAN